MICKSCDECTARNQLPWDERSKLCDRTPDTWTAEDIQQTVTIADWIGSVIDAHSTPEEAQCPTTSSEDSDHHTQNKKSS